jgi:membrane-bound ClpP family serine protease
MIYAYGLLIIAGGFSLFFLEGQVPFFAACGLIFIGAGFILAALYLGGKITGPVDPLIEARIYAIFGQKMHAIDILEKALQCDSRRTDIAVRLAELRGE